VGKIAVMAVAAVAAVGVATIHLTPTEDLLAVGAIALIFLAALGAVLFIVLQMNWIVG
jgi:hypothetical protein